MCAICRRSPCDPRCPNAPDPPTVYTCEECGEGILVGDEFAEIGDRQYHIDCLESLSTRELLKMFDVETQFAEVEEAEW